MHIRPTAPIVASRPFYTFAQFRSCSSRNRRAHPRLSGEGPQGWGKRL